jgi:hypothetical protein
VGRNGLTVWGSHGFAPPLPHRKTIPPGAENAPLARAARDAAPASAIVTDDATPMGLNGDPIGFAIALPILGREQSPLILYAENTSQMSAADAAVAERIAEIVGDHLAVRLRTRRPASAEAPHAPPRQAPRVKFQESTRIAIDGEPSRLIDLSVLGAQVLTPHAIQPDGFVRLLIPSDRGSLSCEARVVWVLAEGQENGGAMYRAGVQFTEVDASAFDSFCRQYGVAEPTIKH